MASKPFHVGEMWWRGVAIQCLLTAEAKDVVTAVKSSYRTAPGCGSAADTCCVCLTT